MLLVVSSLYKCVCILRKARIFLYNHPNMIESLLLVLFPFEMRF